MDIKQSLTTVPMHDFYLKDYKEPIELSHRIKSLGITRMIYSFTHATITNQIHSMVDILKYGQGADHEWQRGTWGSRVYRQAGNLPGWGNYSLTGPNGKEMKDIVNQYTALTSRAVHKDDIVITVWDFTNFNFPSEQFFKKFLEKIENYLIENYQLQNNGRMPVGNIKSESHAKSFSCVDDLKFESLFITED